LLGEVGLHVGQEFTLEALWPDEELSQTELAARVGVQKATMTVTLRALERDGLVQRRRDPDDERVMLVSVTEQGLAKRDDVYAAWGQLEDETVGGLTAGERQTFEALLLKVDEHLREVASTQNGL
jgi:DNA-binding MarR family transcriptional regulator